jgi:enamine deaminase RidA (YjgF/YER057c/UK114 family)
MEPPAHTGFVNPGTLADPPGYSQVITVTGVRTIYVSGQVALNARGELVGAGDLRAQALQVFTNLQAALAAVDATFAHVVKLNIYMLDAGQISVLREVRDAFVDTAHPPASTLVEVRRLAREEFLIEVEAIATLPV